MLGNLVSVQEAAEYLGVSVSTFKRFSDANAIPIIRTPGGHRRINRVDLDRAFEQLWQRPKPRLVLNSSELQTLSEEVEQYLLKGEATMVLSLLSSQIHTVDCIVPLLEETLVVALWRIGERWQRNEIDIYQEHLATRSCGVVIESINLRLPDNKVSNLVAVGGTFERSSDTIASQLIALALRTIGYRTFDLSCNLPPLSIAKAALENQARLVWISHTHVRDVREILEQHELLRSHLPSETEVVIGGGGISPSIRRSLSHCRYFESFQQLVKALDDPKRRENPHIDWNQPR